jgi:hypothetical protein
MSSGTAMTVAAVEGLVMQLQEALLRLQQLQQQALLQKPRTAGFQAAAARRRGKSSQGQGLQVMGQLQETRLLGLAREHIRVLVGTLTPAETGRQQQQQDREAQQADAVLAVLPAVTPSKQGAATAGW